MADETSTAEAGEGAEATPSPDASTPEPAASASPAAEAPKPAKKKSLGSKILDQMKMPQGLPGQDNKSDKNKKQQKDPMLELVDEYNDFVKNGLYQGIDGAKRMGSDIKNLFSKGGKGGDSPAADSPGNDGGTPDAAASTADDDLATAASTPLPDGDDGDLADSAEQGQGSGPTVAMATGANPDNAGQKLDDVMDDFGESWQKLEEACASPSSSPESGPGKGLEADAENTVTSAPNPMGS